MGFSLGNIGRSFINPMNLAQLAMGPAGWSAIAVRTIGSQFAMNMIQQFGEKMGLPQPAIDLAQAAFAQSAGLNGLERMNVSQAVQGFASQAGLNAFETGQLQRAVGGEFDKLIEMVNEGLRSSSKETKRSAQEGKSFLVAIAVALGEVMDNKLNKMYDLSQKLGDMDFKDSKYGETTAELQATGKELDFVSQALNNSLKSIGEAASTVARKN